MDVKREIAAANRRIQKQIDESARAALIRIGVDVEAEDNARHAELAREAVEATGSTAEEFGRRMRMLNDSFVAAAEAFARGWASVR
jgi:hypothetical protein